MKEKHLNQIEVLLSAKKTAIYKEKYSNQWFSAYKNELKKSQELFIYLHFLEIFLRNKISNEFKNEFGDWVFDEKCKLQLTFKEKEKVEKVLLELGKTKKDLNLDNVVSNLNFGFWTNLFHKSYHVPVWQRNAMIERVFAFLKPHQRNLKNIQQELEEIRKFRNRIFHFETMQAWNFEEMKMQIDKFIYGIGGFGFDDFWVG